MYASVTYTCFYYTWPCDAICWQLQWHRCHGVVLKDAVSQNCQLSGPAVTNFCVVLAKTRLATRTTKHSRLPLIAVGCVSLSWYLGDPDIKKVKRSRRRSTSKFVVPLRRSFVLSWQCPTLARQINGHASRPISSVRHFCVNNPPGNSPCLWTFPPWHKVSVSVYYAAWVLWLSTYFDKFISILGLFVKLSYLQFSC